MADKQYGDKSQRYLEGDIRDPGVQENLLEMFSGGSGVRLNMCYYDEQLSDWMIKVDGHKVALGREAKRSLQRFLESPDGPNDRASQN